MMLSPGWMDTDIKNAFTSYDVMISSDLNLMPSRCCIKSLLFCTWYGDFPTTRFQDSGKFFRCFICHNPYAANYGSKWHPFLMHLG